MKPRAGDRAATMPAMTLDRGRVEELVRNTLRELGRQPAAVEVHGAVLLKPDRGVNLGGASAAEGSRAIRPPPPRPMGVGEPARAIAPTRSCGFAPITRR